MAIGLVLVLFGIDQLSDLTDSHVLKSRIIRKVTHMMFTFGL